MGTDRLQIVLEQIRGLAESVLSRIDADGDLATLTALTIIGEKAAEAEALLEVAAAKGVCRGA